MVILSATEPHDPAGSFVVSVNVADVSPGVGVYTALRFVLLEKEPVPPVHVPLEADPPITPANVTVFPIHAV